MTALEADDALRSALGGLFITSRIMRASAATWKPEARCVHVLCPASTTFDAAEALRLELVAGAPAGVVVDVQIAAGGGGSAEDEAGRRLFASERRERMAAVGGETL